MFNPPLLNAPRSPGYWAQVWQQFRRNRAAYAALWVVGALFVVAFCAPLIAGRLPFVWTAVDGSASYPLLREFFAPADTRERLLDIAFNYACLLIPTAGLILLLTRRAGARNLRAPLLCALAVLLILPFALTQARNQPQDYLLLQREGKGHGVFPPVPYGPYQQNLFPAKLPPAWVGGGAQSEALGYSLLGSDEVGRDVLTRLIYGARVSLAVGLVAVGIATLLGLLIGSIAGYYGGWTDILICRFMEIVMCFPSFFLILTVIAMLEQRSILNIMLVIGLTGWTGTAQVIRGEVLRQRKFDYVAGARAAGAGAGRIIFVHILPNAIAPVLVGVSFGIASAILTESGLSFLGLGVSAPMATWGELLNEGRESPLVNWWLSVFPGIAIFVAMVAYNLVGEGLRDAMDPRLRR